MAPGLIVIVIIIAILILHFFNFTVLWWCIVFGIFTFVFVFIRMLLETEGKLKVFDKWLKKIWSQYLKFEKKFFKWIDSIFK